jgi:hypothetical protein
MEGIAPILGDAGPFFALHTSPVAVREGTVRDGPGGEVLGAVVAERVAVRFSLPDVRCLGQGERGLPGG